MSVAVAESLLNASPCLCAGVVTAHCSPAAGHRSFQILAVFLVGAVDDVLGSWQAA